jgi:hypothetical protein
VNRTPARQGSSKRTFLFSIGQWRVKTGLKKHLRKGSARKLRVKNIVNPGAKFKQDKTQNNNDMFPIIALGRWRGKKATEFNL